MRRKEYMIELEYNNKFENVDFGTSSSVNSVINYTKEKFVQFAKAVTRVQLNNLDSLNGTIKKTFYKYTKADILKYLSNPQTYATQLRDASIYLYGSSSHYYRLINYFAKMPTLSYIIVPSNIDVENIDINKFKACYNKAVRYVDNMNIRNEFTKAMTVAWREDAFYGYECSTKDSYYILPLDSKYCKISSVVDGMLCFAYDFAFFNGKEDTILPIFPPEFQEKYLIYKNNSQKRWQELDSKRTVCLKVNNDILDYCIPPFATTFPSIYDIDDYVDLMKARTETGNYKAFSMRIPTDDDTGDLLLDLDICKSFFKMMLDNLPPNVGAILTPMDIKEHDFEKSGSTETSNEVNNSVETYWQGAGVSSLLFGGGDKPTASTLEISIKSDEEMVFSLVEQIERIINYKLKVNVTGTYKFKCKILKTTVFNEDTYADKYLKCAQYSLPTKLMACAAAGLSPLDVENVLYLENDILQLQDKFIPLSSSYTQSAGAPTKSVTELSENGEINREYQ